MGKTDLFDCTKRARSSEVLSELISISLLKEQTETEQFKNS